MERWIAEAKVRARVGDLFSYPAVVVTIESGGRAHGRISKDVVARGIALPTLALGECVYERVGAKDYVFACLWEPGSEYDEGLVRQLTTRALQLASQHEIETLAFPLLGGSEAHRFVEVMIEAMLREERVLSEAGRSVPRGLIVTLDALVL